MRKTGGAFVAGLTAAVDEVAEHGDDVLVTAAEAGVKAAEKAGGSGKAKFAAAEAAVIATLVSKGIEVSLVAAHFAIIAAVAKFNKEGWN